MRVNEIPIKGNPFVEILKFYKGIDHFHQIYPLFFQKVKREHGDLME